MTNRFKIRPFEEHVEREEGRPVLTVKGTFRGSTLLIEVEGIQVKVPLVDAAEDDFGAFGFVESATIDLDHGLKLLLKGDEEEGHISLKDTENDRSLGIFFHAAGTVCGSNSKLFPSAPRPVN